MPGAKQSALTGAVVESGSYVPSALSSQVNSSKNANHGAFENTSLNSSLKKPSGSAFDIYNFGHVGQAQ